MRRIRLAMAQINPTVGALGKNSALIAEFARRAASEGAEVVIFPELALTGYPPEDLLLKPGFIDDNIACLAELAGGIKGITAVVGFVDRAEDIYNAAAVIHDGRVADVYRKMFLPNYGVFDEQRYFQSGTEALNVRLGDITFGIGICEDIWYPEGPVHTQALAGAEVILNINASPYHAGKGWVREEMLATRARDNEVMIAYNNMVGGQDELVFDGQGMIVAPSGEVLARAAAFEEDLLVADLAIDPVFTARLHDPRRREEKLRTAIDGLREITLERKAPVGTKAAAPIEVRQPVDIRKVDRRDEVLAALRLGTADYVGKNGFSHVVVALSGGIDSSLVAAVAADALGPENITCVYMPSRYSSDASTEDAAKLCSDLGIELLTIPIEGPFEAYLETLKDVFRDTAEDTTEENMQARIRGNIIMALSNKFGWLVLTTGNKSEMSVGYATLYGDMAGGFAVIKDVPKTLVYELSRRINENAGREVIPERVITRAPSAELRADQTDQDTLPPYDILDRILKAYVEDDRGVAEIIDMGFDADVVGKVVRLVDLSEYKRRQAPPGVKITSRALGKDRRMPITNGYYGGDRGRGRD